MTFSKNCRATAEYCDVEPRYTKFFTVTHGWRWWDIKDNKLVSPIMADYKLQLPRDGVLAGAYFIPDAKTMLFDVLPKMMATYRVTNDIALTFGSVDGPLELDMDMASVGSMKSTRYRAKVILANNPERLQATYDLPAVANNGLVTMLAVEREYWLK